MICHHKKCIFIHIPKTAGQSIERVFLNLVNLKWETRAPLLLRYNDKLELGPPSLAHLKIDEYVRYKYLTQDMLDDYFKFSFVRNPWDRMISIYKYLGFSQKYEFKSFLINVFKDKVWQEKKWFVRPQSDFICGEDGEVLVDFIGKFENLQDDFYKVCEIIGVPPIELLHVNKSKKAITPSLRLKKIVEYLWWHFKGRGIAHFRRYQDYYDSESYEVVAELYKKDIELFGYKFDS